MEWLSTQAIHIVLGGREVSGDPTSGVSNVLPTDAWELLSDDPSARLIDVRTRAEWGFVGVPDVSELGHETLFIEWAAWPDMSLNPRFVEEVRAALGPDTPSTMLFLCRSGVRSLKAANAVAASLVEDAPATRCLNVAEGFEGDLDPSNHRGHQNGWKARGLAWRQS